MTVSELVSVMKTGTNLIRIGKGAKSDLYDYVWENPSAQEDGDGYPPNDPIFDLEVAEVSAMNDTVYFTTK